MTAEITEECKSNPHPIYQNDYCILGKFILLEYIDTNKPRKRTNLKIRLSDCSDHISLKIFLFINLN